jgi:hypothetical protein
MIALFPIKTVLVTVVKTKTVKQTQSEIIKRDDKLELLNNDDKIIPGSFLGLDLNGNGTKLEASIPFTKASSSSFDAVTVAAPIPIAAIKFLRFGKPSLKFVFFL